MSDWQIHPRNADLSRTFDPLSGWTSIVLVERHNIPDTWTVSGPASVLSVFSPGMGAILDQNGEQVTSGQVTDLNRKAVSERGRLVDTMTVAFASDLAALGDRLVRPSPSTAVGTSITTFPAAYDLRSGTVEDLILGYISSNIGGGALADRRLSRLRLPASQGRGGTTQVSGRFDTLGVLVQSLAEAGNLRVRIKHTEDAGGVWLDLVIEEVADLSADVRFGTAASTAAGLISEFEYELSAPTATRPLVALGDEKAARQVLQLRDAASETLWARAVETFVDQRGIATDSPDKLAEATREGQKALDEGKGPTKVSFTPQLGPDLQYRRDFEVGDIAGYDLPGLPPAQDKVREATTTVAVQSGRTTEGLEMVVGSPDAPQSRTQKQTAKALRAVIAIQRSS